MLPNLSLRAPLCCSPAAFRLLARQVSRLETPDALLRGAVAISMHQMDAATVPAVNAQLDRYAQTVRSRVRGTQPQALLAHLHDVLFDEEGFAGNTDEYYNPMNSYLPAVLETKRGLPITLSLIYKIVGERAGLKVAGVGLPGHFLASVDVGDDRLTLIDPFAGGRVVTAEEAHERMMLQFGPEVEWSEELLRPASNRAWLTRMLQNLLNLFGSSNHFADVAAVLEMEMLLWPQQQHLQRDLALVLARCGLAQPASQWLDRYLQGNPDDPQKSELQQLLDVLK
jgi:regulator of sirC expression with transglutaminase-like and TPR domain